MGENGQSKVFGPYNAEQPAIKEFEKKVRMTSFAHEISC